MSYIKLKDIPSIKLQKVDSQLDLDDSKDKFKLVGLVFSDQTMVTGKTTVINEQQLLTGEVLSALKENERVNEQIAAFKNSYSDDEIIEIYTSKRDFLGTNVAALFDQSGDNLIRQLDTYISVFFPFDKSNPSNTEYSITPVLQNLFSKNDVLKSIQKTSLLHLLDQFGVSFTADQFFLKPNLDVTKNVLFSTDNGRQKIAQIIRSLHLLGQDELAINLRNFVIQVAQFAQYPINLFADSVLACSEKFWFDKTAALNSIDKTNNFVKQLNFSFPRQENSIIKLNDKRINPLKLLPTGHMLADLLLGYFGPNETIKKGELPDYQSYFPYDPLDNNCILDLNAQKLFYSNASLREIHRHIAKVYLINFGIKIEDNTKKANFLDPRVFAVSPWVEIFNGNEDKLKELIQIIQSLYLLGNDKLATNIFSIINTALSANKALIKDQSILTKFSTIFSELPELDQYFMFKKPNAYEPETYFNNFDFKNIVSDEKDRIKFASLPQMPNFAEIKGLYQDDHLISEHLNILDGDRVKATYDYFERSASIDDIYDGLKDLLPSFNYFLIDEFKKIINNEDYKKYILNISNVTLDSLGMMNIKGEVISPNMKIKNKLLSSFLETEHKVLYKLIFTLSQFNDADCNQLAVKIQDLVLDLFSKELKDEQIEGRSNVSIVARYLLSVASTEPWYAKEYITNEQVAFNLLDEKLIYPNETQNIDEKEKKKTLLQYSTMKYKWLNIEQIKVKSLNEKNNKNQQFFNDRIASSKFETLFAAQDYQHNFIKIISNLFPIPEGKITPDSVKLDSQLRSAIAKDAKSQQLQKKVVKDFLSSLGLNLAKDMLTLDPKGLTSSFLNQKYCAEHYAISLILRHLWCSENHENMLLALALREKLLEIAKQNPTLSKRAVQAWQLSIDDRFGLLNLDPLADIKPLELEYFEDQHLKEFRQKLITKNKLLQSQTKSQNESKCTKEFAEFFNDLFPIINPSVSDENPLLITKAIKEALANSKVLHQFLNEIVDNICIYNDISNNVNISFYDFNQDIVKGSNFYYISSNFHDHQLPLARMLSSLHNLGDSEWQHRAFEIANIMVQTYSSSLVDNNMCFDASAIPLYHWIHYSDQNYCANSDLFSDENSCIEKLFKEKDSFFYDVISEFLAKKQEVKDSKLKFTPSFFDKTVLTPDLTEDISFDGQALKQIIDKQNQHAIADHLITYTNYDHALTEIKSGKRTEDWLDYIFPYISVINDHKYFMNLEKEDPHLQRSSINTVELAKKYLNHAILGPRLIDAIKAMIKVSKDNQNRSAEEMLNLDYDDLSSLKFLSCLTLFSQISKDPIFEEARQHFFKDRVDTRTLSYIEEEQEWDKVRADKDQTQHLVLPHIPVIEVSQPAKRINKESVVGPGELIEISVLSIPSAKPLTKKEKKLVPEGRDEKLLHKSKTLNKPNLELALTVARDLPTLTNVSLYLGDICHATEDVVVNAANCTLQGGSGIDGIIHRYSIELDEHGNQSEPMKAELKKRYPEGCITGEARATAAYGNFRMQGVNYIIHAVGPDLTPNSSMNGTNLVLTGSTPIENERQARNKLINAYKNAFRAAMQLRQESVAVPILSSGIFKYPEYRACEIALSIAALPEFRQLKICFYLKNAKGQEIESKLLKTYEYLDDLMMKF